MATIRNRGGVLQIDFIYRGVRCRESLRFKDTPANRKHAERLAGAIEFEISTNQFNYRARFPGSKRAELFDEYQTSSDTVGKALARWLEIASHSFSHTTLKDYRNIVYHTLIPQLGNIPLQSLQTRHIKEFQANLKCGPKRKNNILIPLRRMLDEAHQDGLIERNPADRIKNLKTGTHDPDPFTPEEINTILESCREEQIRNLFQFAFFTGLRTGELIALEWGDIDWLQGYAHIRRSTSLKQTKEPKTQAGNRSVKLFPQALEALKSQRKHTELQDKHVFHDPRYNAPWNGDKEIREWAWRPVLRRAKVRYRYPYQTRHTYACMLLTAGENPAWIANQMGHADWGMIRKVYARWIPSAAPDAGTKFETLWENQPIEKEGRA